ncbi:exosortase B [Methylovorus glucosotrophus]|jgi:exosortase B|uniref:Exosortase 2 n=1 Tax=Methylovorus glucosotrophus (strain SIP3-4) TaxID=582744 RepID=C6X6T3_METGS|nr:exosortase B [Methylovorus glucosotrophus]ACT51076.1 exosortase 2 [Methylovorus glucosotrophus SIP3-4]
MNSSLKLLQPKEWTQSSVAWVLIALGLGVVYFPSFWDLFHGIWGTERHAHGPIVFVVSIWFFYFKIRQIEEHNIPLQPAPLAGWVLFSLGLVIYIIGRSQTLLIFEIGSLIPVLLGITLITFGKQVAKFLWFAFFFLCFVVPLPALVVDMATLPMKTAVSYATEHILYMLDYPISRSGVMLTIGQYQLLVADACAGLNSLFTLEVLGLLYMNVTHHESPFRNFTLAVLIVPISFMANVTRVIVLSLITYHWGDEAGQGFLHEFSGLVLFITALILVIGTDSLLRFLSNKFFGTKTTQLKV